MDKTLITAIIAIALAVAFFFAGRVTKECPTIDDTQLDVLTQRNVANEFEVGRLQGVIDQQAARIDSLNASRKNPDEHVQDVLPTIPLGRNSAELDSLRAILLRKPK